MREKLKALFLTCCLLLVGFTAAAQQEVKGVVTDDAGEPLPGVTVMEVGTTNGVITNLDGIYSITVKSGAQLQFSFVGMHSKVVAVTNSATLDVVLESDEVGLEEITVVAYGTQKKVTITGAITSVGSEEIGKSPSANITNALAGKVTGVAVVQNTGEPGLDEASLHIRGAATLNDASPLVIVDGVERPFSQLNPDEVESISILKDASATAVYGVRGANGVIIVTTKRGEQGKTRISVSSSMAFQQPTNMLDKSNSYIYALGHNERNVNDGNDPSGNVFSEEALEIFKNGGNILYPDMDWYDYLFKDFAPQTKTNVTITGGTERVRYFSSVGYLSQDGQLNEFNTKYNSNFTFKRYNYRTNLDIDVTNTTLLKFTIGGSTQMKNTPRQRSEGLWKEANWAQPMAGSGIVDGKWVSTSQENITLEYRDPLSGSYGRGFENESKTFLNFDIDLVQKLDFITQGLRARVKGAYNTNYTHTKIGATSADRYEAITDPNDPNQVVFRKIGDESKMNYSQSTGKARNWYAEAAVDYNRKFGKHNLGGLVLANQRVVYYPKHNNQNMDHFHVPQITLGIVNRVTYDYDTKYMAEVNLGYNGSATFAEGQRFGFFPAFSLGWILTEESFMENVGFLNYFKIRGSYGLVGNDKQGLARFLYLPDAWNYGTGGYNFGYGNSTDQEGATELRIGNPDVTWETAVKQNIGFDAMFFDSRLKITADYFHEYRNDILIQRSTVPSFVAAELPVVNMGEVENQGYEIELKWSHNVSTDFSYQIGANMSYARNKRLFVDEVPQPYDYLSQTGTPIGQPFGYITDGFFTEEVNTSTDDRYPDHSGTRYPGDLMYKDLNDDGKIDDLDMKAVGYSPIIPEYNFGANLYVQYKGFDLSMTFSGVANTSRILPSYFREPFGGQNRGLFTYLYEGRWTPENADNAIYPRFSQVSSENNYKNSDLYIVDASYIRLKNIELGYRIKSAVLKKAGLRNVRVFASGYNLLTFTDFHYYDPESNPGSAGLYPMIKMYNMGLKFNF